MTTPAQNVLILYSLPTDVQGAKLDEQIKEIEVDVGRIHDAIGRRAAYDSVQSLRDVAHVLDDYPEAKVVFNLVEEMPGGPDEVNAVPMICRAFGKRCTGNLNPARDKFLTNRLLAAHGIPVPQAAFADKGFTVIDIPDGAVIVKPAAGEGSEGIDKSNVAEDDKDRHATISRAIAKIHAAGQDATIEEMIDGREVTCGVILKDGKPFALPLLETVFEAKGDGPKILDYKAKWAEGSKEHQHTPQVCPAKFSLPQTQCIQDIAVQAWRACALTSYARVDFRIKNTGGGPYVIEINSNPDLGAEGGMVEMMEKAGIKFETFIKDLIEQATST